MLVIPGPKGAPTVAAARAVLIDGCKGTARRRCPPSYPPPLPLPSLPLLDRFLFGGEGGRSRHSGSSLIQGREGGRVCARKSGTADMTDGPRADKGTFFTKYGMCRKRTLRVSETGIGLKRVLVSESGRGMRTKKEGWPIIKINQVCAASKRRKRSGGVGGRRSGSGSRTDNVPSEIADDPDRQF